MVLYLYNPEIRFVSQPCNVTLRHSGSIRAYQNKSERCLRIIVAISDVLT